MNHSRYHSKLKGCKMIFPYIYDGYLCKSKIGKRKPPEVIGAYCETHKAECSKTGWEWHWYLGADSLKMTMKERENRGARNDLLKPYRPI